MSQLCDRSSKLLYSIFNSKNQQVSLKLARVTKNGFYPQKKPQAQFRVLNFNGTDAWFVGCWPVLVLGRWGQPGHFTFEFSHHGIHIECSIRHSTILESELKYRASRLCVVSWKAHLSRFSKRSFGVKDLRLRRARRSRGA